MRHAGRHTRGRPRDCLVGLLAWSVALLCTGSVTGIATASRPVTVTNYTDPAQAVPWAKRSHWAQPWRSYMDTVPATKLLHAIGINFNVSAEQAASTARLLHESGFTRARIEVGWNTLSYSNPSEMTQRSLKTLETDLVAFRSNDIRPLILLNANDTGPCPFQATTIHLASPAAAGEMVIHISPSDVSSVISGRTGIDSNTGVMARFLFASVADDGTVQLSAPLDRSLAAGELRVKTLLYEPFHNERTSNGLVNPAFEPTIEGWSNYVHVVTREVARILGSDDFDVEVWNELSFGSTFLNVNRYYEPWAEPWATTRPETALLESTIAQLTEDGLTDVKVGDGFSNERPGDSGANVPIGVDAIDKHPYRGWYSYPTDAAVNGIQPLNGLGEPAGWKDTQWHESFTPTYDAFFPEFFLSGIQTETLVHDLAPTPSVIYGVEHGRFSHASGGAPPQMWITEVNLDPASGPTPRSEMSKADIQHVMAKDILRYLVAFVNKGVSAIDFYAAEDGNLSLVAPDFFEGIAESPFGYPGRDLGGPTTSSVRRLTEALAGAKPIPTPRQLSLQELTDYSGHMQFEGNGTAEYPPLYNRDVFSFFPFQVDQGKFVIPVYVMTRNVAKTYGPSDTPSRFDLPPEPFRMKIGGADGRYASVRATDPLTGNSIPVDVIARDPESLTVQMAVTDSPRLLIIEEDSGGNSSKADGWGGQGAASGETTRQPSIRRFDSADAARLRLRIRGAKALLRRHAVHVTATYSARCTLRVRGRFRVRRHVFRMRSKLRRRWLSHSNSRRTQVSLAVSSRAIALARNAADSRHPVIVSVRAEARDREGRARIVHRRIRLRLSPTHRARFNALGR